jgi:hypothetical protein
MIVLQPGGKQSCAPGSSFPENGCERGFFSTQIRNPRSWQTNGRFLDFLLAYKGEEWSNTNA